MKLWSFAMINQTYSIESFSRETAKTRTKSRSQRRRNLGRSRWRVGCPADDWLVALCCARLTGFGWFWSLWSETDQIMIILWSFYDLRKIIFDFVFEMILIWSCFLKKLDHDLIRSLKNERSSEPGLRPSIYYTFMEQNVAFANKAQYYRGLQYCDEEEIDTPFYAINTDLFGAEIEDLGFWDKSGRPLLSLVPAGNKFQYEIDPRHRDDFVKFFKEPTAPRQKQQDPDWSMQDSANDIYFLEDEGRLHFWFLLCLCVYFLLRPSRKFRKIYHTESTTLNCCIIYWWVIVDLVWLKINRNGKVRDRLSVANFSQFFREGHNSLMKVCIKPKYRLWCFYSRSRRNAAEIYSNSCGACSRVKPFFVLKQLRQWLTSGSR